jgi:hypothetical protein
MKQTEAAAVLKAAGPRLSKLSSSHERLAEGHYSEPLTSRKTDRYEPAATPFPFG